MRKKVFIPVGMMVPEGMVTEAEEIIRQEADVIYALDEGERGITFDPKSVKERRPKVLRKLEEVLPEIHGLYTLGVGLALQVTGEMMDRAPNLEVVASPGSGSEHIDADAATERGIPVVHAAGTTSPMVSEHAVALAMTLSRRVAVADRWMHREKSWPQGQDAMQLLDFSPAGPVGVDRKTIGLVGYGFIGRQVGDICRAAFKMRVLAYDPYFDPLEAERQGTQLVDRLLNMLPECDFVFLTLPMSPQTRHIIGEAELRAMKGTAYLINTSRGPLIDTNALVRALEEGWIAGAGLDVADPEPLPDKHPLFDLDNVVLTPHLGGNGSDFRRIAEWVARDMAAVLRGDRLLHRLVNPEVMPKYLARLDAR